MARAGGSSKTTARRGRKPATPAGDAGLAKRLADALAPWFLAHQRDLSWRRTRDPYAIWVSEVMLQQTRVETVERYWSSFLARFPDAATLAAAELDAVLQAWSGLGYYRRARMLHRGAEVVARDHGGRLPHDAEALRSIPGIGPYTAGAIASIAHDRPEPLVDGNVARVLSRVQAIAEPREQLATARGHWALCAEVLRAGSPRILAQALMELGATVCTPRSPACEQCPVRSDCRAWATGTTATIPAVRVRGESPIERWWALAVDVGDGLVLERRPREGLLAGLWCLPLVARPDDEPLVAAALHGAVPVAVRTPRQTGAEVVHVFTHRRWELQVVRVTARAGAWLDGERYARWRPDEAPPGGVPTLTRKLLARALAR
jgi:A/G-specific adenine glycosylase